MRIARVTCHRQLQPFADGPYVLSGDRVDDGFDSLVVRIVTDVGVVGWGEMSPLGTMYDPAFADGAFAAAPLLSGALIGQPVASTARILDQTLKGHPYAKSAFDMAAWDALGQRAAVPGVVLYCDANGGWSVGDARRFLAATTTVAYVLEQPCATYRECLLLRPQAARPMVLDESIVTVADAVQAAVDGIDGITIKISRVGGITAARLIRDTAVALGLMVTVEDTGGADIDTAAMAHLSISTPSNRRAHTVDFHHWVTVSNGRGIPPTDDGLLRPPVGAGLGIDVDEAGLGSALVDEGD